MYVHVRTAAAGTDAVTAHMQVHVQIRRRRFKLTFQLKIQVTFTWAGAKLCLNSTILFSSSLVRVASRPEEVPNFEHKLIITKLNCYRDQKNTAEQAFEKFFHLKCMNGFNFLCGVRFS